MSQGLRVPAHIAALQQASATGTAAVQPQNSAKWKPGDTTYAPNNHPAEKMIEFMTKVYERLHFHIFNECGWTGTPQAGAQDWHFADPTAVISKPVNITDLIHAYGMPDVIMEYQTHDAEGRKQWGHYAEKCQNGLIRGEIFKGTGLPAYTLYCNFYGRCYVRKLIPQNTGKTSTYALRARGGECISWAIKEEGDGTFTTDAQGKQTANNTFLGHFENEKWIKK